MNIEVNYLGVLLAGVASMALGFLWYHPVLFGKPWMKLMGHTAEGLKKAQKEMGKLYGLSFVVSLITAYVLFHVMTLSMNFFHYPKLQAGLTSAFWMWIGFVMPVQLTDTIFSHKKWNLWAINTGYQLASLIVMAVVLALL
ncbi:MAG: DUF1761 domain-containing protein [Candidatus Levyibacteriota bacterium]